MRLSEIADRLELQRSGAHRMLGTLCGLGWVEQDPETEFYRLTLKLSAVGHRFMSATRIPDVCQPLVDRLSKESRELVRLAVLAGGKLTTIAHAQGARGSLICQSRTFPILPLHVTASGKAWLATLGKEQALKLVLEAGFGARGEFGPNALRSVDALSRELAQTRKRGYGLALEEAEPGVSSVAATIRPDGKAVVGAIAIVAPAVRLSADRIPQLAELAKKGADELGLVWPLREMAGFDDELPARAAS